MNVESKYHKEKWENSCGYLFPEKISSGNLSSFDIIQARIRYDFEMDTEIERFIESSFRNLDEDLFWAAVVASKWDLYGSEWKDYKDKGRDFKHIQLMEVMSNDYPIELKKKCLDKLKDENSPYLPTEKAERIPASKIDKRYEVKAPKTDAEPSDSLAWMDEDDFWGFDKQEFETPSENLCTIVHKEDVHEKFLEQDRIVKTELKAFIRVGEALKTIRDQNLYQEDYGTFEEYCFKELGWKRRHAYYQIDAYEVSILLPEDKQPLAETHVRELTPLAKDNIDAAVEVWNKVNKEAEEEGRKITAKDVKRGVEEYYRVSTSTIESIDGYCFQYPVTMSDGKKVKKSHQQLLDMGYTEDQLTKYRRNDDYDRV